VSLFLHASWLHLGGNMLFCGLRQQRRRRARPGAVPALLPPGRITATLAQLAVDPSTTAAHRGIRCDRRRDGRLPAVFPKARILTWLSFLLIVVIYVPAWLVSASGS